MLNHPRGTSLERLSGWIRTTGGPPVASSRARANRCWSLEPGGRRLGWEPLGRSTTWHGLPGRATSRYQWTSRRDRPRQPLAWLSLPRASGRPTIPRDLATCTGLPGWQVLQVAQSVAIPATDHSQTHSESARLVPNGHRFRRFNSHSKMFLTDRGSTEHLRVRVMHPGLEDLLTDRRICTASV